VPAGVLTIDWRGNEHPGDKREHGSVARSRPARFRRRLRPPVKIFDSKLLEFVTAHVSPKSRLRPLPSRRGTTTCSMPGANRTLCGPEWAVFIWAASLTWIVGMYARAGHDQRREPLGSVSTDGTQRTPARGSASSGGRSGVEYPLRFPRGY
jgi:hypothetical protein